MVDRLFQFPFRDSRCHFVQLCHRPADDPSHKDDDQNNADQDRQDGYGRHDTGQYVQLREHLRLRHVNDGCPVAVRNVHRLDICTAVKQGQLRIAFLDLLRGICIHIPAEFTQKPSGDLRILMADDRVRPGIYKEYSAGLLQLDLRHDIRDRVQIYIRSRHAAGLSVFSL